MAACWLLASQASAYVYWANEGTNTISRANLDGTSVDTNFIAGANAPRGVAVDGHHIYWVNVGGTSKIARANLDGSEANQSFMTGVGVAVSLTVDSDHIYWVDGAAGKIGRANLDGSDPNPNFITGADEPTQVRVDSGYLYWTNSGSGTIGRADLSGSGVVQNFIDTGYSPRGLAVNGGGIYWSNSNGMGATASIGRANPDGSGVDQNFQGSTTATGLAVDGRYLYWAGNSTIGRADLDGSSASPSFIPSAGVPAAVAVDALPAGTATPSSPSLDFGRQLVGGLTDPQSLTVTNSGSNNLQVGLVDVEGGDSRDFVIASDDCSQGTLAPGGTCTIVARFRPHAPGNSAATLAIPSNDPAGPLDVRLSGGGYQPYGGPGTDSGGTPAQPAGPAQPRDPVGRKASVRCTLKRTKVRCRVYLAVNRAAEVGWRLVRHGRVYAHGVAYARHATTTIRLSHTGRLPHGSYRLQVSGVPRGAVLRLS
jgi:hypothetical protein